MYCFLAGSVLLNQAVAQGVENRGCPTSYTRNNGNGQAVSVFASNITPSSVYSQSALTSGSQGNFTFKWATNVSNPPVINKTWLTATGGTPALNWSFGNNGSGSPFNPPGVPLSTDVKYTFYNSNLPTSGTVTFEFIDPYDGSYVNTCSYPLSSGASSTGSITSQAIAAPKDFYYSISNVSVNAGVAGNSVTPNINAAGGTVTYSLSPTVDGITINSSTGIISWNSNTPVGTYNLTVTASNGIAPDATTTYTITVTDSGVSSGSEGGLESKNLGTAVAERVFQNSVQNKPATVDYKKTAKVENNAQFRTTTGIRSFMPDQNILGTGFTGFITSPSDILSFTNAKEVVSVDYVQNGINKAVAFCTQTNGAVYTHTKPVCDRLKGSVLLAVDTMSYANYKFLRYYLKPANGLNEYAISFSAGYNRTDNFYTLQSEWTTDRYAAQDTMLNFQIWSADASILGQMLGNILFKLNNDMPVTQTGIVKRPMIYITKAERNVRDQRSLQLTIKNQTSQTSALVIVSGKANEQSVNVVTKTFPVALSANGISIAEVPVLDMAEAEIRLLVNGADEDFVYSNDGIWNIYKTPLSTIQEFSISNDTIQPKETEYRLFRNIQLKAITSDYITVYRMVKGGGVVADLSAFPYLKFAASGTGNVRIRLIKKTINNFDQQYEYVLPLQKNVKEYCLNIKDFKSSGVATSIVSNDVTIVSFTYEAQGSSASIESTLKNVRFAKTGLDAIVNNTHQLNIYPNPAKEQVTLQFQSAVTEVMNVEIIHSSGAQVMMQQKIKVVQGNNQLNLLLPVQLKTGVYMVQLKSDSQQFQTKILKIN